MTSASYTNELIHETSPYLLQHAHNPVNWYAWSSAVLARAKEENKPILVSIGYSACHWCHVMEKESFEDVVTANIMNEHFINIKIDREERPDLDHIYMDAVQAIAGNGGWPLNVFLTPEGKPFYGGTYFPPIAAYNRPSWKDVLNGVIKAFREKNEDIVAQAEQLTSHLLQANSFGFNADNERIAEKHGAEIFNNIMAAADKRDGGFGAAPKFPQSFSIQYLLRYYHYFKAPEALEQACLSLDKMIMGGIYDHVGGGFARYATDSEWIVPHFEKMLYDNALLISTLSEAYLVTNNKRYLDTINQTLEFVQRDLMLQDGGFYAALDADSEGEEGKYYVWDEKEIKEILGADAKLFCNYYNISGRGNWEGKNIIHAKLSLEDFANQNKLDAVELATTFKANLNVLLRVREKRLPPQLDDKILLGWNALMNTALSKAFAATGNEEYKALAIKNMKFLVSNFSKGKGEGFYHTYKNNTAKYPAFLDDYAYLLEALIHLQEITAEEAYLQSAVDIAEYVIENFSEYETGYFFFTHKSQQDVIVRKKEIYDGATPSGNAIMAYCLYYLSVIYDKPEWKQRVEKMVTSLSKVVTRYPTSFGVWANLMLNFIVGSDELVLLGKGAEQVHKDILHIFMPFRIMQVSDREKEHFPMLKGKHITTHPLIFLCKSYSCRSPVTNVDLLKQLLVKEQRN